MPSQANITVKKNDGITDILYTALQPSSGDNVQAIWKSLSVGTAPAHQPELRCSARQIQGGKREVRMTYVYPVTVTNTTTNTTSVLWKEAGSYTFVQEPQAPTTDHNEAVAQFANLIASAHAKAIVQGGFGPT